MKLKAYLACNFTFHIENLKLIFQISSSYVYLCTLKVVISWKIKTLLIQTT